MNLKLLEAATNLEYTARGRLRRRQVDRLARKHRPAVSRFFRDQKRLVLAALATKQHLFSESFRKLSEGTTQFTLADWGLTWDEIEAQTTPHLHQLLAEAEADALIKGATFAKNEVGLPGFTFDLANPRAVSWFAEHAGSTQYIKGIQRTSQKQIQTILTRALDTGQSYNKTASQIRARFSTFSKYRAQLIATHESAQAYEAGSYLSEQQMVDTGIVLEKMWENSGDELVTPECQANTDAGWIPFEQDFPSGHLHPPRFPGCRCWHIVQQKQ